MAKFEVTSRKTHSNMDMPYCCTGKYYKNKREIMLISIKIVLRNQPKLKITKLDNVDQLDKIT